MVNAESKNPIQVIERMKSAWSGLVRETAEKISRAIGHRG